MSLSGKVVVNTRAGHSMFDPELYRDKAEVEKYKEHDPIVTFTDRCIAEGLLSDPFMRRRSTWYGGLGLAAAALVVAAMLPGLLQAPVETFSSVPDNTPTNTATVQLNTLQTLMTESRRLESDLRALPDGPRVMRAGTMATISDIEDRIAAIDYQLNDPDVQMSPEDRELFWRERVRLMKSLLQLRYAQAQRAAF